jgi:hypothetical protein
MWQIRDSTRAVDPEKLQREERAREINTQREADGALNRMGSEGTSAAKPIREMSDKEFIEHDAARTQERKLRQRLIRETR